jgi:hypothetical protein
MAKFNLVAQLQLQSPANVQQVVNQLRSQFGSIGVPIKISTNTKNIKAASTAIGLVNTESIKASNSVGDLGRTLGIAARRFGAISIATGTFLALTRTIKNSVKEAIDFQRELNKIVQTTGASDVAIGQLRDTVQSLSKEFGVSSGELVVAARTLAQAGFSAKVASGALKVLAQTDLAATFDTIQDTTEGSIALLQQFGREAIKTGTEVQFLEESLSAISSVSKAFAVESADIVSAIRKTGGSFEAAGGNLNELLALFTSVRATTRESADTIATAFRTIFTRIQRVETIDALKELGISLQDTEGKFVGPLKAIEALSTGLSVLDTKDFRFSQIVENLGGFRQIGKVIPLLKQFAITQDALNVAQNASGGLAEDAEIAQKSLAVQIAKVREEFKALIEQFTETELFQDLAIGALQFARSMIKVAEALKPILPLVASFAAIKLGQTLIPAARSFTGFGRAKGGPIPGFAEGGVVPVALMPGEIALNRSQAKSVGYNKLQQMNRAKPEKFAGGGFVGMVPGSGNSDSFKTAMEPGGFVIRKRAVEALGQQKLAAGGIINQSEIGILALEPDRIVKSVRSTKSVNITPADFKSDIESKRVGLVGPKKYAVKQYGIDESLQDNLSNTIRSSLLDGLANSINSTAELFKPELQIKSPVVMQDPSVRELFRRSIGEGTIGSVFEAMISSISNPKFDNGVAVQNRPFDFIGSIGSAARLFPAGADEPVYKDAKATTKAATKLKIKVRDQMRYDASSTKGEEDPEAANRRALLDKLKNTQGLEGFSGKALAAFLKSQGITGIKTATDANLALNRLGIKPLSVEPREKGGGFNYKFASGGKVPGYAKGGSVSNKAFVFDFDDTLASIDSSAGKSFTNYYGEGAAQLIASSSATRYADMAKKRVQKGYDVHVLTARPQDTMTVQAIQEFMMKNIGAQAKSVIGVAEMFKDEREPGKRPGTTRQLSIQSKKAKVLKQLAARYNQIIFADDNQENVLAGQALEKEGVRIKSVLAKKALGGSIPRFADGGLVPAMVMPGEIYLDKKGVQGIPGGIKTLDKINNGDIVPGTGNKDSVATQLEPGGYVLRKSASEKIQKFATGGAVGVQKFSTGSDGGIKSLKDLITTNFIRGMSGRVGPTRPADQRQEKSNFIQRRDQSLNAPDLKPYISALDTVVESLIRQGGSTEQVTRIMNSLVNTGRSSLAGLDSLGALSDKIPIKEFELLSRNIKNGLVPKLIKNGASLDQLIVATTLFEDTQRDAIARYQSSNVNNTNTPNAPFTGGVKIQGTGIVARDGSSLDPFQTVTADKIRPNDSQFVGPPAPPRLTGLAKTRSKNQAIDNQNAKNFVEKGGQLEPSKIQAISQNFLFMGGAIAGIIPQFLGLEQATADLVTQTSIAATSIFGIGGTVISGLEGPLNKFNGFISTRFGEGSSVTKGFASLGGATGALNIGLLALTAVVAATTWVTGQYKQAQEKANKRADEFLTNLTETGKGDLGTLTAERTLAASEGARARTGTTAGYVGGAIGIGAGVGGAALIGAALGSVVPVLGTVIGAAVGGAIGAYVGSSFGADGGLPPSTLASINALSKAQFAAADSTYKFNKALQDATDAGLKGVDLTNAMTSATANLAKEFTAIDANRAVAQTIASRPNATEEEKKNAEAARVTSEEKRKEVVAQLPRDRGQFIQNVGELISKDTTLTDGGNPLAFINNSGLSGSLDKIIDSMLRAGFSTDEVSSTMLNLLKNVQAQANAQIQNNIALQASIAAKKSEVELILKTNLALSALVESSNLIAASQSQISRAIANASGSFESASLTYLSAFDNLSNVGNTEVFSNAARSAAAPLGPAGQEFADQVINSAEAIRKLRTGLTVQTLENVQKSTSLGGSAGSEFIGRTINDILGNTKLNEGTNKFLVEIIQAKGGPGAIDQSTVDSIVKELEDNASKYTEVLKESARLANEYVSQYDQATKAIIDSLNKENALRSGMITIQENSMSRLEKVFAGRVSESEITGSVDKRERFRTARAQISLGASGTAGDIGGISETLSKTQQKISFINKKLSVTTDPQKTQLLNTAQAKLSDVSSRLTSELVRLTDQSEKASDVMALIDREAAKRGFVSTQVEDFVLGTNEQRTNQNQVFRGAEQVAITGSFQGLPEELRKSVADFIGQLADLEPGGFADTARRTAIFNDSVRAGINPQVAASLADKASTSKEDKFINDLRAITDSEVAAQNALIQAQQNNTTSLQSLVPKIDNLLNVMERNFQAATDNAIAEAKVRAERATQTQKESEDLDTKVKAKKETEDAAVAKQAESLNQNIEAQNAIINTDRVEVLTKGLENSSNAKPTPVKDAISKGAGDETQRIMAADTGSPLLDFLSATLIGGSTKTLARMATGGPVYSADGGSIFKPKGTDTVPAMLTPGEYVVKKSAVDKYGQDTLSAINNGTFDPTQYYQEGGEAKTPRVGRLTPQQEQYIGAKYQMLSRQSIYAQPKNMVTAIDNFLKEIDSIGVVNTKLENFKRMLGWQRNMFQGRAEQQAQAQANQQTQVGQPQVPSQDNVMKDNLGNKLTTAQKVAKENTRKRKENLSKNPKPVVADPLAGFVDQSSISGGIDASAFQISDPKQRQQTANAINKARGYSVKFADNGEKSELKRKADLVSEMGKVLSSLDKSDPKYLELSTNVQKRYLSKLGARATVVEKDIFGVAANESEYDKQDRIQKTLGQGIYSDRYKMPTFNKNDGLSKKEIEARDNPTFKTFDKATEPVDTSDYLDRMKNDPAYFLEVRREADRKRSQEALKAAEEYQRKRAVSKTFANGGMPKGTDTVPAMLTPGEYVVNKSSVDKYGKGLMDDINSKSLGFNKGGVVYKKNGGVINRAGGGSIPSGSSAPVGGFNVSELSGIFNDFSNTLRSTLDNLVVRLPDAINNSMKTFTDSMNSIVQGMSNISMTHELNINGQIAVAGLDIDGISEAITKSLGEYIGNVVKQELNADKNKFKAG